MYVLCNLNIHMHVLTLFESVSVVLLMFHFRGITESKKNMSCGLNGPHYDQSQLGCTVVTSLQLPANFTLCASRHNHLSSIC